MDETATSVTKNPKDKGGRPSHVPTPKDRRSVEILAGFGLPQRNIAHVVGLALMTLRRHYQDELDAGAAKVEAQLIGNLVRLAQGADSVALRAIMFSLTCRFGWSAYGSLGKKDRAQLDAELGPDEDSGWYDLIN